jgi:hypothetical protein
MRWAYLVVAAAAAAGVAAFALPRGQAMKMGSRIDGLIQRLRSPDVSTVESAAEELRRIAKSGVTEDEAICLLRGAAGSFPERKFEFQSTPADLVRAAAENPTNGLTSVVAEVFSALAQPAKTEALVLLMKSSDRRAAESVIELLHSQRNAKATIETARRPCSANRSMPTCTSPPCWISRPVRASSRSAPLSLLRARRGR